MGLLLDAIGGAAAAGQKMLADQREADLQQEKDVRMAELNSKLIQQRTEALEVMRLNRGRLAEQAEVIDTEAAESRAKRELDTANKVAPSVDAEVMKFIKTTLPPDQVEKYYGVKAPNAVDDLNDKISVARQHGFYESENGLRADRKGALAEITGERREHDREKRTTLIEQRDEYNRLATEKRLERMGQGGGSEPAFVATYKFLLSKGYSKERIEEILTQKKAMSAAELSAKLAGKEKPANGAKDPRKSLEGESAYMDDDGNIRKTGGELVKAATPRVKPDASQDSKGRPRTYSDAQPTVAEFNARMAQEAAAKKAEQDVGMLDRLLRSFGGGSGAHK